LLLRVSLQFFIEVFAGTYEYNDDNGFVIFLINIIKETKKTQGQGESNLYCPFPAFIKPDLEHDTVLYGFMTGKRRLRNHFFNSIRRPLSCRKVEYPLIAVIRGFIWDDRKAFNYDGLTGRVNQGSTVAKQIAGFLNPATPAIYSPSPMTLSTALIMFW
jgi:hypothetical protein